MALGDPYASLVELKDRLGITDAAEDLKLAAALTTATDGIEHCCGRQFNDATSATARVFRADSARLLEVDDFSTTSGLLVATDANGDGVFEVSWPSSDYQLEPLNGVVHGRPGWPFWRVAAVGSRRFPCGRRATVQVTARWGWATVPPAIKESTLILSEDIFKLASTPFGAGGYGEFGRIRARENPHVMTRIYPYQHPLAA